jgi:NADH dehydrogenase (ubiquinone) 1 alpha/beta subcomplex 1, acyl-carrier protein
MQFSRVSFRLASFLKQASVTTGRNNSLSMLAVSRSALGGAALTQEQIAERVLTVVKNFGKVDAGKVQLDSHFMEDLGLDSLDTVEVVMAIEEEFAVEIPDEDADRILSIKQAVEYLSKHPEAK